MPSDQPRYAITELNRYATDLFAAAGVPPERAAIVAQLLVEADAMGHDTHGLNLCAQYLDHLQSGEMAARGEFTVIADRGATVVWDGSYLSGVWLTHQAIQLGCQRAKALGTATISIRRSHHIACLAAFLPLATDRGLMITLASSDPSVAAVAPFGSYEAKFTPNPLAVGIPTATDPILIDISASATTMGLTARMEGRGEKLAGDWLVDNQGRASNDPAVLEADPPGALLALGGLDRGHKGFALAIMIEALTSGLPGYGRANGPPTGAPGFACRSPIRKHSAGWTPLPIRPAGWPINAVGRRCREAPRPCACPATAPWPAGERQRKTASNYIQTFWKAWRPGWNVWVLFRQSVYNHCG